MSWPMVKLSDVCEINIGKTPSRSNSRYWGEGHRWLSIADMNQGKWISNTKEQITDLAIQESGIKKIPANTVLFSFKLSIGKVCLSETDIYTNEAIAALPIKNKNKLDTIYLSHVMKSLAFSDMTDNAVMGATLNKKKLAEVRIPLPSIEEQKRIAAILDKADGIRQKCEQAIKLADNFLRTTFLDIFGDPVKNPKKWGVTSLLEYGSFKNGMNFSKGESGTMLKCLGVGDFKSLATITSMDNIGEIELNTPPSAEYLLKDGDIVFVRSNGNKALVGRCLTIYPGKEKVTFSGFCIRYRIEKPAITPEYLNFLFRTPSMKQQMLSGGQGANIQNISQGTLSVLRIPVPPLDKQLAFARLVDFHASIVKKQYDKTAETEKLFNALTGGFFTFNE
ncbi:restriction endonuclease subunit S [Klebsiella michiganensis]|nr:restriction endonuclease subunit S [Klebsiella michiganensis]MCG8665076.1 restriction endonuclease subunit S [Klebsiella michiganensis]